METEPENLLDPNKIDPVFFPEAQSVAFFETRLWLHGSWESPSNLLSRIDQLVGFPIWICQGQFDEVCPRECSILLSSSDFCTWSLKKTHNMVSCIQPDMHNGLRMHWERLVLIIPCVLLVVGMSNQTPSWLNV